MQVEFYIISWKWTFILFKNLFPNYKGNSNVKIIVKIKATIVSRKWQTQLLLTSL